MLKGNRCGGNLSNPIFLKAGLYAVCLTVGTAILSQSPADAAAIESSIGSKGVICAWENGNLLRIQNDTYGLSASKSHVRRFNGERTECLDPPKLAIDGYFIASDPLLFYARRAYPNAEAKVVKADGNARADEHLLNVIFEYKNDKWCDVLNLPLNIGSPKEVLVISRDKYVLRYSVLEPAQVGSKKGILLLLKQDGEKFEYRLLELEGRDSKADLEGSDQIPDPWLGPRDIASNWMYALMEEASAMRRTEKGFILFSKFLGTIYAFSADGDLLRKVRLYKPQDIDGFWDYASHPNVIHDLQATRDGAFLVAARSLDFLANIRKLNPRAWPGGGVEAFFTKGSQGGAGEKATPEDGKPWHVTWFRVDPLNPDAPVLEAAVPKPLAFMKDRRGFRFEFDREGNIIVGQGFLKEAPESMPAKVSSPAKR